jgi:uncharacterized membrane protein
MMVVLFFALIFFWYSLITEAAFNSGVGFIEDTVSNLNRFFIAESRSSSSAGMFGKGVIEKSILYKIEFVFKWLTFIFIGIGVITAIRRYKEWSFPELSFKKSDFLKKKFDVGFLTIAIICSGLLATMITLPYITRGYDIVRLHAVTNTILSVFFVVGGITLSKQKFKKSLVKNLSLKKKDLAKKQKEGGKENAEPQAYLIILLVLIPYFLFVTGFMFNIGGVPHSLLLNSEGRDYSRCLQDTEIISAKWLCEQDIGNSKIYTAGYSDLELALGYEPKKPDIKGNLFARNRKIREGYICLSSRRVVKGEEETEYAHLFVGKSKIYNSGYPEIWI